MGAEMVLESMTIRSRQVLEGTRPVWEVVGEASGDAHGLLDSTRYAGMAYAMWAEISDLYDGSSPDDEKLANKLAREVAAGWLAVDASSGREVERYFKEWEPYFGRRFRAAAGWRQWSRWSRPFWVFWGRIKRHQA